MTEYILLILYFSAFICLCTLVCLYFSGCQEMTYKHDGKDAVGEVNQQAETWCDMIWFTLPERNNRMTVPGFSTVVSFRQNVGEFRIL